MNQELEMNTDPSITLPIGPTVHGRRENDRLRRASSLDAEQQAWPLESSRKESANSICRETIIPSRRISPFNWLSNWAILATVLLLLQCESSFIETAGLGSLGVQAHTIRAKEGVKRSFKRDDTNTDVCSRWSHQSAIVNGTLYLYGGRATQTAGQKDHTWNNDFLSLSLAESWEIASPKLNGLPRPSGPPPISDGYLWHSHDALYLYGGEYSEFPFEAPDPFTLWEYDIKSSSWREHTSPKTSAGNNSADGNQPIQRVAEGAGVTVPELGRGYYFGGHYDHYTTPGWSLQTPRLYLKSLVEYTFPGYGNDAVESLSGGKTAGEDGVWRNITEGGIQNTNAFPQRADGVLVHVPGFGKSGILVSLAGGNNETFFQLNVVDVFDQFSSQWYKQATDGKYPELRVNPCAVAASAPDGSSTNIYVFGGQNLLPYGNQTQYNDMWILSIPSFKWIEVDSTAGQSIPPARVGHTCNMWDGQIVVVGGYTGPNLGCDSGFYVFSASELIWKNDFKALGGGNSQNQQVAQENDPAGLSGSYGYQVPKAVQAVIGGNADGGATITAPVQTVAEGPLATGKPITYSTITGANGAVITEPSNPSVDGAGKPRGPNIAAIVAGVVAGCFAVLAGYLGFCAWIYRRQLALYKAHVAMTQRAAAGGAGNPNEKAAFLTSEGSSDRRTKAFTDQGSGIASTGNSGVPRASGGLHLPLEGNSTANSSCEDLMAGAEPTFVGVLLNPRRSLRVINRD